MLQIITGRFFKTDELYRTQQRTVLYSNYRGHNSIDTLVGTYAPAAPSSDVISAVYLVEQQLEAVRPDGSREVLIAVHPEALAQDFAALLSFCLRVTCSLDPALVSRLSQSNRPPIGVSTHPSRLVEQIFDREVWPNQVDEAVLPEFVAELVRLERARYKAVMRAIRRYVVGLHRIGDDLALSYTLLVASIESLAQDFDQFEVSWSDFDPGKREKIDQALADTDFATREAVQSAILEVEHVALSQRYREFALAHLPPSFYREEAAGREGAARACDLPLALSRAYAFRSRLVHRLEELPVLLVHAPVRRDIIEVDGKPTLTFSGLARVARRVIMLFVELSPKLDTEDFDYRADLPNVFLAPMAPRYWIWKAENYHARNARRFLSGFLSELESVLMGHEEALTDIGSVLEKIEQQVPALAPTSRLPMVALYLLYHRHLLEERHRPVAREFLEEHASLLDDPSLESLICHTVLSQPTGWDPDKQEEIRRAYLAQRYHKNGLQLGPLLEVAMILETAEAYRLTGDRKRARILLSDAVENLPGNAMLLDLEQKWLAGEVGPLRWRDILLPAREN
jgi:hypothetical protein